MTEQQAIEALHALPRLPRSGASLERMPVSYTHLTLPTTAASDVYKRQYAGTAGPPWKPGKAV